MRINAIKLTATGSRTEVAVPQVAGEFFCPQKTPLKLGSRYLGTFRQYEKRRQTYPRR
jgi:hypothetical protein